MTRTRPSLRSPAGILVVPTLVFATVVVSNAACSDPARPQFGPFPFGPDTIPPTIEFVAPPASDSILPAGSQILVHVAVRDRSPIRSVASGVLGAVSYGFETLFPDDTIFEADFPITTPAGVTGAITLRVVATDTLDNRSSADRRFLLR